MIDWSHGVESEGCEQSAIGCIPSDDTHFVFDMIAFLRECMSVVRQ